MTTLKINQKNLQNIFLIGHSRLCDGYVISNCIHSCKLLIINNFVM